MLESIQPRGLAFAGVRAVENADGMAALFEFGCGGEDICLRPAERAKLFVNKQYSHDSILLLTNSNNVKTG